MNRFSSHVVALRNTVCVILVSTSWLGFGCSSRPAYIDLEFTNDCVEGARSFRFHAVATGGLVDPTDVTWRSRSPNISPGPPTIVEVAPDEFDVTFALSDVGLGETVTLLGEYFIILGIGAPLVGDFVVTSVVFYPVPPDEIVGPAPCDPAGGPTLALRDDPVLHLVLDVSNQTPEVGSLSMHLLQLVALPTPLPPEVLEWNNTALAMLPWIDAIPPGTILPSGTTPIVVDLPDGIPPVANTSSAPAEAVLLRYQAVSAGGDHRAIWQAELTSPVTTESRTWGAIKAMYR